MLKANITVIFFSKEKKSIKNNKKMKIQTVVFQGNEHKKLLLDESKTKSGDFPPWLLLVPDPYKKNGATSSKPPKYKQK